jgi:hypothetical protein
VQCQGPPSQQQQKGQGQGQQQQQQGQGQGCQQQGQGQQVVGRLSWLVAAGAARVFMMLTFWLVILQHSWKVRRLLAQGQVLSFFHSFILSFFD